MVVSFGAHRRNQLGTQERIIHFLRRLTGAKHWKQGTLCYLLQKERVGFNRNTDSVLKNVMRLAVETGSYVSSPPSQVTDDKLIWTIDRCHGYRGGCYLRQLLSTRYSTRRLVLDLQERCDNAENTSRHLLCLLGCVFLFLRNYAAKY